jgi:hypothetical protein
MDHQDVIERTRGWISAMVIGLNLCPFARRVFDAGGIRYAVTETRDEVTLREELAAELKALAACPAARVETTLLIHPHVLTRFLDYNDFVGAGEQLVAALGLRGVIQLAGFHPEYQFAGTAPGAVENYTNRSPYPMLHLLREASVTAATSDPRHQADAIPRRNVETLRGLGRERVLERLRAAEAGRHRQA